MNGYMHEWTLKLLDAHQLISRVDDSGPNELCLLARTVVWRGCKWEFHIQGVCSGSGPFFLETTEAPGPVSVMSVRT